MWFNPIAFFLWLGAMLIIGFIIYYSLKWIGEDLD